MIIKIEIGQKKQEIEPIGFKFLKKIKKEYPNVKQINRYKLYFVFNDLTSDIIQKFASILYDPIIEEYSINKHIQSDYDWLVEISFKYGVTDNEGKTASEILGFILQNTKKTVPSVHSGFQFRLKAQISRLDVIKIAEKFFANTLIQNIKVYSKEDIEQQNFLFTYPVLKSNHKPTVNTYEFSKSNEELTKLSKKKVWALNINELRTIEKFFKNEKYLKVRMQKGLSSKITDVEMECIAQSWSEHCKHKIFSAKIEYEENNRTEIIDGLLKTYIKKATSIICKEKNKNFCLSVFKDNAGVITFNEDYGLVFKVETHNSPSALDPYGGALTGILGVNRDPFGTGMGASLLFNTNVFCLAHPSKQPPSSQLLHPFKVMEGVREGVEDGGNQSGIPTINGSVVFDDRYIGKPLVYCGTGGIIPKKLFSKKGYEKYTQKGDLVVMCGGKVGIDGIHGATFSSEKLSKNSPVSAVQIGDPITQKRMFDFLLQAQKLDLYSGITDNGAGGLSSSVGEMADLTGGATIDLAKVPIKYKGLDPWEILVSESQERMTVSVPKEKITDFLNLSKKMNVESTVIGEFTNKGYFEIKFDKKIVGLLDLDFLKNGVPQMMLETTYKPYKSSVLEPSNLPHMIDLLKKILARPNVASKEYWVRQYDHEVKGGSVIKPLVGAKNDGPSDAAVIRPFLDSMEAVVVSHGIVPRYGDIDAGIMAENAFDEAVRNAVAVGGDPTLFAVLDNFCWSDPLPFAQNHKEKLAALVRANKKLFEIATTYKIPFISGKDSMKNDTKLSNTTISVPHTLLVSLVGKIENALFTQTMDAKTPQDLVYVVGLTKREMGKSELYEELKIKDTSLPKVNKKSAFKTYLKLHKAIKSDVVASCHDCSDGGLGVALAETAFAGRLGMDIDLTKVPCDDSVLYDYHILFSESASRFVVTVPPYKQKSFEQIMKDTVFALIGSVTENPAIILKGTEGIYETDIYELYNAWKQPLNF